MAKKPRNGMKNGVIYARYSSHNQKDASIEQQVAEATKFAASKKIQITEIYADRAISGTTDKRPEFQRMMADAEQKKFGFVIAWKSNRIGRNMLQAMANEETLTECGVSVLYTEEDFDDSAAGRFALRSMMNVNQFYSENMAEDVMRGMMDNAKHCKVNGKLPYGYKRGKDGKIEIHEVYGPIVQEIYRRVDSGEAYAHVMDDLNDRGIKTSTGGKFVKSSFWRILHNERYRGIYVFNGIRTEGGIPRIVEDDVWFRVQEYTKTKKNGEGQVRRMNKDYVLTGKACCAYCGAAMIGTSGTGKSGTLYHYYKCKSRLGRGSEKSCNKKAIPQTVLEDAVANLLVEECLTDEMIEIIADYTVKAFEKRKEDPDLISAKDELKEAKRGIQNLMNAIEAGIITPTTKDRLLELEATKDQAALRVEALESQIIDVDRDVIIAGMKEFRDRPDHDGEKFQRELFTTFLRMVYVTDDTITVVFSCASGTEDKKTIPLLTEWIVQGNGTLTQEDKCSHMPTMVPHCAPNTNTQFFLMDNYFIFLRQLVA